ncbi:MAG: polysaccharide biosynthesis tyrosine autokinase, partial [Sphingomonas sp.]
MTTNLTYEEAPFDPAATSVAAAAAPEKPAGQRLDERAVSAIERYWRAMLNRRLLILAVLLASMTVGVITYLMATPLYTTTARIEIQRSQAKVVNMGGLELEDRSRDLQFYETQYNLLKARSLAERVARVLGLQNDDKFFAMYGDGGSAGATGPRTRSAQDQAKRLDQAASILLENISVDPIGASSLVDISFKSPNAELSAKVANSWAAEYIQSNLDRRFATTADARGFLEQRLAQLRSRLETSERELVAYASGKGIVSFSSGGSEKGGGGGERTLVTDDLSTLNAALNAAVAERVAAESAVRASSVNPSAASQGTIASLRQKRAELSARYSALLTKFEPGYPEAEALRTEIMGLDKAIAQEGGRSRSDAEAALRAAQSKEAQFREQVANLTKNFNTQRTNLIEYQILQREVDTNRTLYDGLLQRYKEIGVAGVGSNNIAIVDPAEVPGVPSEPNLNKTLLVSLLIGLVLAMGLVVLAEEIDQSLRDPADVQRELGLPLLGTIPKVEDKDVAEELQNKKTQLYESYLAVRTNLSFLTDHGAPSVLMLTSSRPNEGKSLSAYALSRLFAETGASVVLIDADMRNTRLDDLISLDERPGLSNYLSGANGIEEVLQQPRGEGFAMIPAGPTPPNAAELLSSDRFKEMLATLRERYRHVIIDAPPVLGLADAPLLSRSVDGILFVV